MGAVRSQQRKLSIQSATPEPERAGKGTRRTLRSLSLRITPAAAAYRHGRACSTLRVHAKLALASCPDDSLDIWPVTGSAVTSGTNGHREEALTIGKGASSTCGSAAWQRHLKVKHACLVLGALRSPRQIFLLCEDQPLE